MLSSSLSCQVEGAAVSPSPPCLSLHHPLSAKDGLDLDFLKSEHEEEERVCAAEAVHSWGSAPAAARGRCQSAEKHPKMH